MRMSRDGLWSWWLALAVCLGAAWWASIPVKEHSDDKGAVVNLDLSRIGNIDLSTQEMAVTGSRRQDLTGRWWIDIKRKAAPQVANVPPADLSALQERFMASAKFDEMLALFSPFQALRVIGKPATNQLKDFGLDNSTKTLVVKDLTGAVLLSLKIGKQLYGSRNVYVMDQADQTVMLIAGDFVTDFEKPELRVYERAITRLPMEEIQAVSVTAGGKIRKFSHLKRDSKSTLLWTPEEGDGAPVASAASWFERFDHLKAATYATAEEQTRLSTIAALFEVALTGVGSATEAIQMRKVTKAGKDEYWLTSSFLGWHVKVAATRAEALAKDLPQLMGQ